MRHFFDPENFFWQCFDKMADVLVLSMLWFLISLPLVTVGAATTALYDSVVHCVRRGEKGTYGRFFRTFKREFKTATLAFLPWAAAALLAVAGYHIMGAAGQETRPLLALAMVYYASAAIPLGILCWMFPLLSRYEFGFRELNRAAMQFWCAHLPSTIGMVVLLVLCVGITMQTLVPVCVLPALLALVDSFLIERAFKKSAPQDGGEADGGAGEAGEDG